MEKSHRRVYARQKGFVLGYITALKRMGKMPEDVSFHDLSAEYRQELLRTSHLMTERLRDCGGDFLYSQRRWADPVDNSLDTQTKGVQ